MVGFCPPWLPLSTSPLSPTPPSDSAFPESMSSPHPPSHFYPVCPSVNTGWDPPSSPCNGFCRPHPARIPISSLSVNISVSVFVSQFPQKHISTPRSKCKKFVWGLTHTHQEILVQGEEVRQEGRAAGQVSAVGPWSLTLCGQLWGPYGTRLRVIPAEEGWCWGICHTPLIMGQGYGGRVPVRQEGRMDCPPH